MTKEGVMVVVIVTTACNRPEEKKSLLKGVKKVLRDAATAALVGVLAAVIVDIAVWVFQTLSNQRQRTLLDVR